MSDNNATDAYVTAEWIRRPQIDLGNLSPTDAAADAEGRKKLDDLLTELTGIHVRLGKLGLPAVNPADIRKALGIEAVHAAPGGRPARQVRATPVKRNALLDELGTALTGGDMDSVAFFNAKSGAVEHFMHNLGDQENARIAQAEADADLKKVVAVTTEVRYGIMSDFIGTVEDIGFAGKLRTAISGKGAFKRFRETVDEDDAMRRRWLAYRTKRHYHLALDWMHRLGLDPAAYSINPAEFDWEPAERPAREHAPKTAVEPPATAEAPPATAEAPPATAEAPPATAEAPPATAEEAAAPAPDATQDAGIAPVEEDEKAPTAS
jgi:Uncharacterised protein family (UPF0158)